MRFRAAAGHAEAVLRVSASQLGGDVREEPCPEPGWRQFDAPFRAAGAARLLLGFGAAVRVLGPPEVVADLRATAAAFLDAHP